MTPRELATILAALLTPTRLAVYETHTTPNLEELT